MAVPPDLLHIYPVLCGISYILRINRQFVNMIWIFCPLNIYHIDIIIHICGISQEKILIHKYPIKYDPAQKGEAI